MDEDKEGRHANDPCRVVKAGNDIVAHAVAKGHVTCDRDGNVEPGDDDHRYVRRFLGMVDNAALVGANGVRNFN